jgi:hypothetical protein
MSSRWIEDSAAVYEIRIGGHLGETFRSAFPGFDATTSGSDTLLRGPVRDQAQLHWLLARIADLGLQLLEMHRLTA